MNEQSDYPIDRFLRAVAAATERDDRGYLAELRRGLSETTQSQAWEHLIPYSSDFDSNPDHCAIWCTVGGLAALLIPNHLCVSETWHNLGTTMRAIARGAEGDEKKALKTFEPKFRRALSCDDTLSLCEIVVGIGRTASVKGVTMNLRNLFWDLWNWSDAWNRDKTRLRWAKQYYRVIEPRTEGVPSQGDEE